MFIKKFILISLLIVSGLYSQDEEVGNEEFYKEIAQGISVEIGRASCRERV